LELIKAMEVGHIFKLGYRYSQSMGLRVLNEAGEEVTVIMGSYGIGVERILSAAIELFHDKDGMALPVTIAPFQVVVTPVNNSDASLRKAAEDIYGACLSAGLDALLDDRDERPGVKFKDADLIGIPYRITVGKKLPQGLVEVVERRNKQTMDVKLEEAAAYVKQRV
jgi:prolyl-tRNA synthetase